MAIRVDGCMILVLLLQLEKMTAQSSRWKQAGKELLIV
jgi:hypothetical protein